MRFDREILKRYLDVTSDTLKNSGRLYGPVRELLGITDISHLDKKMSEIDRIIVSSPLREKTLYPIGGV